MGFAGAGTAKGANAVGVGCTGDTVKGGTATWFNLAGRIWMGFAIIGMIGAVVSCAG
jgi:hypothetical protein